MGEVKKLIDEYAQKFADIPAKNRYKKVIELNEELASQIRRLFDPSDEILAALEKLSDDPCHEDATFWLTAGQIRPSTTYLKALCAILVQEKECIWHEGVLYILQDLKDERSIPYLDQAISLDLEYDSSKEVAKNALEALARIGTPEAAAILKKHTRSADAGIRQVAEDYWKLVQEKLSD